MKRIKDLLKTASEKLSQNGIENSAEETGILFEYAGGPSKKERILSGVNDVDEDVSALFLELIEKRASGTPLQYILGEWDFYGNMFYVGEGVLIPRAETQMLVDEADNFPSDGNNAKVLDLCAGTGCVGITAALHNPSAQVYMVEKSDLAFGYLKKNTERYNLKNAHIIKGDIFNGVQIMDNPKDFDVLLSNPPYIATEELETLQAEVRQEPRLALDGGADGLDFYRAVCELWLPALKKGALVSLECGEDQTERLSALLSAYCENISVKTDFNGLPRTVTANYRGE